MTTQLSEVNRYDCDRENGMELYPDGDYVRFDDIEGLISQALEANVRADHFQNLLSEVAAQQRSAEPVMVLTTGDKVYALAPSELALKQAMSDQEELHRMQMVAIQVTAQCNTRESSNQQRCPNPSPFRTLALDDVEKTVDREIEWREKYLALKVAVKGVVRDKLDDQTVHPCDVNDDKVKAHAAGPIWENLYNLVRDE